MVEDGEVVVGWPTVCAGSGKPGKKRRRRTRRCVHTKQTGTISGHLGVRRTPRCVFWFKSRFLRPRGSNTRPVTAHKSTSRQGTARPCVKSSDGRAFTTSKASLTSFKVGIDVANPSPDATTAPVLPENIIPAHRKSTGLGTGACGCSGQSLSCSWSLSFSPSAVAVRPHEQRDACEYMEWCVSL